MSRFRIEGGIPLAGVVHPMGNKNEALPALAAALLSEDPVVIDNVPRILDVATMLDLLRSVGAQAEWTGPHEVTIHARALGSCPDQSLCGLIRGSLLLAAPLLSRTGRAVLPLPGGDKIGRRRLDPHLSAFSAMGVSWRAAGAVVELTVGDPGLHGGTVDLDEPSVTATENALMLAASLPSRTVIHPAACEPHVQGLCRMLTSMGARIEGVGSNRLVVEGAPRLRGCSHVIAPDHIEIGSFVGVAAATRSLLTVQPVEPHVLGPVLRPFRTLGMEVWLEGDSLHCDGRRPLVIHREFGDAVPVIDDGPWPAIPADIMSILVVAATQAHGTLLVFEKMFESRLFWIDRLIAMGAHAILCDPHRVVIVGPSPLRGTSVVSPDIRAGMALVIAALAAEGTSIIENITQVDRGYEALETRLASLGARIWREG